jgi:hypothetical protein
MMPFPLKSEDRDIGFTSTPANQSLTKGPCLSLCFQPILMV